jgi:hypothetical protein
VSKWRFSDILKCGEAIRMDLQSNSGIPVIPGILKIELKKSKKSKRIKGKKEGRGRTI